MKFVIAVDLEGVAGVVGYPNMGLTEANCPDEYALACRMAVRAVSAAARALFDGGAAEVVVWDNHGRGVNLPIDQLDPRVSVFRGSTRERWRMMDGSYSGVLLIGYHAMAGTPMAVLAHSYSSEHIQSIHINGVAVGEIAADAHVAGAKGAPVIFVESDRAGVDEARRFMPWVRGVITKTGYGRNAAIGPHPDVIDQRTYDEVTEAVRHLSDMRPFVFPGPLTVDYRYMRMEGARDHALRAGGELLDEYTARFRMDELELF